MVQASGSKRVTRMNSAHLNSAHSGALFGAALLALSATPSALHAQSGDAPPPAVVVAPAVQKPVSASAQFIGQAEAYHSVDLRARVTGFLTDRSFTEGGLVSEGDVLYVIDPAEYEAARDAAQARVQNVEATIEEAEAQLERYEKLATSGTASEAALDEARATAGRARADLAAANAELDQAKLNLGYTQIDTPISGRIGQSSIDTGNLVGPDSGVLASVVAVDPIYVTFSVTERDYLTYVDAINSGEVDDVRPQITLVNGQQYPQDGEIDFIGTTVSAETGTIPVRATFPNPDGILLPGQFMNVTLMAGTPSEEIVVPQAALQQNQSGYFVLIVDANDTVEQRPVTIGQRLRTETVIQSGLEVGEQVIVEGVQKVRPGVTVTAVPAETSEAG